MTALIWDADDPAARIPLISRFDPIISDADDPATRNPLLSRFDAIGPNWRPVSRSGVPWIDLLREYAFTLQLLGNALADDPGCEHTAGAFDALLEFLWVHYFKMVGTHNLASDFSRFAQVVTDLLRSIEHKQRAAVFKLPPNDSALSKRLRRLGVKRTLRDVTQWTCLRCLSQFTCTYPPTCPTCARGLMEQPGKQADLANQWPVSKAARCAVRNAGM